MAEVELPIDAVEKNYTVTTVLDEETFTFVVRWNGRIVPEVSNGFWVFDLYDVNGSLIVAGVPILLGVLLGRRSVDPRMPKGALMAADTQNTGGKGRDAGRDDLGTRVKVYYFPAADVA